MTIDSAALTASLEALGGLIASSVSKMGAGVSDTLSSGITQSVSNAHAAGLAAVSGGGFENIGAMISQGLANGIRGGYAAVASAASAVVEGAKSVIASSVRVQSPSKWAEEVGAFIDEGLANGVSGSAELLYKAADEMMGRMKDTVVSGAEETSRLEIASIDAVIEAEKAAIKERERARQLELRQHAIEIAVDSDVKRRAIEYLSTTEREYALQDLEEYRKVLLEKQKVFEEAKAAQIRAIKDISYEERIVAYDDYELKIKLYNDEYLEKVRNIDEGLYAFLSAKNSEMEAVIERIALEDSATAERLAAILEEKNAIIEKSRLEKELRDEKLRADKEAELLKRVMEAETGEEQAKRWLEYAKWRQEEEYRLAEKGRQARISSLESEYKEIIETVKEAQKEIEGIRREGDLAVERAAETIKAGIVDIDTEAELLAASTGQQTAYLENSYKIAAEYYAGRAELMESESRKEYTFLQNMNDNVLTLLRRYIPLWRDIGAQLMDNLCDGLYSRLGEVNSLIDRLRAQLESLNIYSDGDGGGDYGGFPMYGTGGVVTTPRLAVVGDTPEAIIPLSRLNDIITATALYAAPYMTAQTGASVGYTEAPSKNVYVNQTNNIYQPVKSPAETARAIKNMSKGLAKGL